MNEQMQDARTSDDEIRRVVNRLKRARGQLTAVIDAMETDADCRDVVIQLAAVGKAIDRAGFAVISTALRHCIGGAQDGRADDGGPSLAELEKLFMTLA
jgi:DNA-binding FrmR family transcriptional regulator